MSPVRFCDLRMQTLKIGSQEILIRERVSFRGDLFRTVRLQDMENAVVLVVDFNSTGIR